MYQFLFVYFINTYLIIVPHTLKLNRLVITVAAIVGSDELAAKYINVSAQYYLARGHLAPDGDFIDANSQDSSYYFINVTCKFWPKNPFDILTD